MEQIFNNNPSLYIDMNGMFPILNETVGLTSEQWRKAIENCNYLYNHLGLANVEIGRVQTIFTRPGTMSNVEITHEEREVGGKVIDYFNFTFYIPSPKIESTLVSETTDIQSEVGMTINQEPIYGQGSLAQVVIGYKFNFNAKFPKMEKIVVDDRLDYDSVNPVQNKVVTESIDMHSNIVLIDPSTTKIPPSSWSDLNGKEFYKFKATLNLPKIESLPSGKPINMFEYYLGVKLYNDNPELFAKYGFNIGEFNDTTNDVTIYAIEKPNEDVILQFGYWR